MARKTTKIEFTLTAPEALSVSAAGTFNGWSPENLPLRKDKSGTWKASLSLPAGRHEYCFVVDGQWVADPRAKESVPNPFGGQNSIVVVL